MNMLQHKKYKDAVPLLKIEHLSLSFRQLKKGLKESLVEAIADFHLTVKSGEIVAIVGASGAGKSLLADAILGILPESAELGGTIHFDGEKLTRDKQIEVRGDQISLIPQSLKALDPLRKTGKQVQAAIPGDDQEKKRAIQQKIFQKLNLPAGTGEKLPFELSGGMARRVLIATAMASESKLIIADEPTPGLDEDTRDKTVQYVKKLATNGRGILFITHDINTALQIADKVAVFYEGKTVEVARVEAFAGQGENLKHPYTKALWNALPENNFHLTKDADVDRDGPLQTVLENKNAGSQLQETAE